MKISMIRRPALNVQTHRLRRFIGLWMFGIVCCLFTTTHAGPRTSANYSITADIADAGGRRTTSANYTNDASAGGITGISSVAAPAETAKAGYIGQLTEVTALQLAATPATIEETATRQLSAAQLLDDGTTSALPANTVSWTILSGSIASISTSGLATAAIVYENSVSSVQGSYAGANGTLPLTVLDTIADNFSTYAADGIGDDWQVQYFGKDNPDAAPLLDPDGDGQTNMFEFTAGIIPTNPLSRFLVTIAPVPDQPTQKQVIFAPVVAGRTYIVKSSPDLATGSWITLAGSTSSDNGSQRTVIDTAATPAKKFYTVEIVKP